MRSILSLFKESGKTFYAGLKAGARYSGSGPAVSPARLSLLVCAGIASVWAMTALINRIAAEQSNNAVEICLDFDEAVDLCQRNGYRLDEFLERCRLVGATSIVVGEETVGSLFSSGDMRYAQGSGRQRDDTRGGIRNAFAVSDGALREQVLRQLKDRYGITTNAAVNENGGVLVPLFDSPFTPSYLTETMPLGFSKEKLGFIRSCGYRPVMRIQNAGNPRWMNEGLSVAASTIIVDEKEVPGYPGDERAFADVVRDNGMRIITVEFAPVAGLAKLKRLVPQQVVLGHTITPKELNRNMTVDTWRVRWQRGVRERGVRFILFHFFDTRSIDDNMRYLRAVAADFKSGGYLLDQALPPGYPHKDGGRVRLYLALLTVVVAPLAALAGGIRRKNPLVAYFVTNALTLSAGLFVAALLFDHYYMQKIVEVPAVKLTMFAPLLLAPFILFSSGERQRWWGKELRLMHLALAGTALALLAVLLVRSGNTSAAWLQPDQGMRQFFEHLLAVRPRTKEFLFGQPLLFFGFYLRRKELLWLGVIGQLSMMNTFLHAHTPVMVSLVRSLHGVWLGLAVAGAAALAGSVLRSFRTRY